MNAKESEDGFNNEKSKDPLEKKSLSIKNFNFGWKKKKNKENAILKSVNLNVQHTTKVGICGKVGSGKV